MIKLYTEVMTIKKLLIHQEIYKFGNLGEG
jgi:hypothetical protein